MAYAQKPDFFFRRNGRVHLNRRGRQFSRLVCASAVVMLDTSCSEVVWRVLATHSIRQFLLYFPPVCHRVPSHFNCSLQRFSSCCRISDITVIFSSWTTDSHPPTALLCSVTLAISSIKCVSHKHSVHHSNCCSNHILLGSHSVYDVCYYISEKSAACNYKVIEAR